MVRRLLAAVCAAALVIASAVPVATLAAVPPRSGSHGSSGTHATPGSHGSTPPRSTGGPHRSTTRHDAPSVCASSGAARGHHAAAHSTGRIAHVSGTHRANHVVAPARSAGYPAARDSNGRIVRSRDAKAAFERQTGYPHGRPGYVVDHIVPLAKGGADDPSNMQWQTVAEAKAKDRWERR